VCVLVVFVIRYDNTWCWWCINALCRYGIGMHNRYASYSGTRVFIRCAARAEKVHSLRVVFVVCFAVYSVVG